jgi:hypothetical protein
MSTINVGHKVRLEIALGIRLEGLGHHDGTQIGAADTNVHDRLDGLSRISLPPTAPYFLRELAYVLEDGSHFIDAGLADLKWLGYANVAQGDMEDGSVLRSVYMLAAEHIVAGLSDLGLLGELEESVEDSIVEKVL